MTRVLVQIYSTMLKTASWYPVIHFHNRSAGAPHVVVMAMWTLHWGQCATPLLGSASTASTIPWALNAISAYLGSTETQPLVFPAEVMFLDNQVSNKAHLLHSRRCVLNVLPVSKILVLLLLTLSCQLSVYAAFFYWFTVLCWWEDSLNYIQHECRMAAASNQGVS